MELIQFEEIQNKILTIRGVQVMLDKDLASFYEIKAIRLREQVKRNPNRFPADFVFQLNENEVEYMVSQNAIPSVQSLGGYLPYVFTEQGVAAASGVIKSDKSDDVSVALARAFVAMRKFILNNASVFQRLDTIELKQLKTDEKLEQIFKALDAGQPQPVKGIFFDGQVFDAYLFVADIVKRANRSIILIDNFVDETVLSLLSKRSETVAATIYTKTISKQLQLDRDKHNAQYPPIDIQLFTPSHDRFLIIDNAEMYHLGASLKDLGKKWFAFSKMDSLTVDVLAKLKNNDIE